MSEPAYPSLRSTQPPSPTLTELTTRIREGRYQVPADEVADRILTNLQPATPRPDGGWRWSASDQHANPDWAVGPG